MEEALVNSSLDDLIKQNKAKAKKKTATKPAAKKVAAKKTAAKKAPAKAGRKGGKKDATAGLDNMTVQTAIKIAQAVGYAKAARNDQMNKRRPGLQQSASAGNKQQMRAKVNKQVKQKMGNTASATARPRAAAARGAGKLKISFNPGELKKTTDKTVSAQIFGAMSRAKGFGGNAASAKAGANGKPRAQAGKGGASVVVVRR